MPRDHSRRRWLAVHLAAIAPQIQAAQEHAHEAVRSPKGKLESLDAAAAREIEAIAARIIPTDDTPGAREAGVIYFIDRALATFDRDKRPAYRNGIRDVQARVRKMFPGAASFAGLAAEQQDQVLKSIENTDFFELVRFHTVLGFFGHPSWGGNRNRAGWKLIGFDDRAGFEPPFGYYDREAGS